MPCDHFFEGDSFVHRMDPRVRAAAAFGLSLVVALSHRPVVALGGLAAAVLLSLAARLPAGGAARRLAGVNIFMIMLAVFLPFSVPGSAIFHLGPLPFTREGLMQALFIALKGNAVVLLITVLLGTMDVVKLGHALARLGAPPKLIHLFLFTVRYIDVLEHEYRRMATAMKVRCFRPGMNAHTYRAYAHLVAMLLVRSYDRSNRILAAMKCRGFQGRFFLVENLSLRTADILSASGFALLAGTLAWVGWS